ncbi:MAG TPA: hypothetical protein VGJ91_11655 [Polyangiaceae bacterium]|jgi:hypothetical protein
MSTPQYFVFDGDPDNAISPRRPGIDDVGGGQKQNDAEFLPDPDMPDADDDNQHQKLLVGLAKVASMVAIYVKFVSGVPTIFGIRAVGSLLQASDFTITDVATGKVKLACPGSKIVPPLYGRAFPQATGNNTATAYVTGSGEELTVEVRTAGTLADVDFVVEWC